MLPNTGVGRRTEEAGLPGRKAGQEPDSPPGRRILPKAPRPADAPRLGEAAPRRRAPYPLARPRVGPASRGPVRGTYIPHSFA